MNTGMKKLAVSLTFTVIGIAGLVGLYVSGDSRKPERCYHNESYPTGTVRTTTVNGKVVKEERLDVYSRTCDKSGQQTELYWKETFRGKP